MDGDGGAAQPRRRRQAVADSQADVVTRSPPKHPRRIRYEAYSFHPQRCTAVIQSLPRSVCEGSGLGRQGPSLTNGPRVRGQILRSLRSLWMTNAPLTEVRVL